MKKHLKLKIALTAKTSKADLANIFGNFEEHGPFIQFSFPNVFLLSRLQLKPIIQLLDNYEREFGALEKTLFLEGPDGRSPSSLFSIDGVWYLISSTDEVLKEANDLFSII